MYVLHFQGRFTVTAGPGAPAAGGGACTYSESIMIKGYYDATSPFKLQEVIITASDAPACTNIVAILISEEVTAVTPHAVSRTVVDKSCSECQQLNVYGQYTCPSGTYCAGSWAVSNTIRFTLSPDYTFTGFTSNCTASGPDDNILTCTGFRTRNFSATNS
jgi:hypothetical protein